MKLPSASLVASIAIAALPLIKAFDVIDNSNSIDTGILDAPSEAANYHDEAPFFRELQSNCPATCSSELCECVSQYGYAEPCALQLHNVCTAGTIADCVAEEYVFYYSNVYCPFAACRVNGQSYEKCNCDSYVNFCGIYQNKAGYESDAKTIKYCEIATCCSNQSDDVGRLSCLDDPFREQNTVIEETNNGSDTNETEETGATETVVEAEPTVPATTSDESLEPIDLTSGDSITQDSDPPPAGAVGKSSALTMAAGAFVWWVV